ncbi:MAG TPA: sulfotransferase [Steroidobacteraceae bacterium]|nr:sulfotransferase [Steroidobacteraceae bacterium]
MNASPLFDHALKQHRRGDVGQAVDLYKTLLDLHPDHADVRRHLGLALLQRGELSDAEPHLLRALELLPQSADVCSDLGTLYKLQGRLKQAERYYCRALELDPNHSDALQNFGTLLLQVQRPLEAVPLLERLAGVKPNSDASHRLLGDALYETDRSDEAIDSFLRAIELNPNDRRARLNLGEAYEARGLFQHARVQYIHIVERRESSPLALAKLLQLRDSQMDPKWVQRAQKLAAAPDTKPEARTRLHVALGHHLDRCGRYEEAFAHFKAGNDAEFTRQPFDAAGFSAAVDALIEVFDERFWARLSGVPRSPSERPLFIVGMPRSGTTLTEQILASHSRVAGGGELATIPHLAAQTQQHNPHGEYYPSSLRAMGAEQLSSLAGRYLGRLGRIDSNSLRVTDKLPFNFLHLGFIAALFPRARVIQLERDPLDNCLSCYFTSFATQIRFASDLATLARYYVDFRRLMAHWRRVLPLQVMTLRYEGLIRDTAGESRQLIDFCGLDWEAGCLDFHQTRRDVKTPSRWQVRQPIYTEAIGRWRRYEQQIEPLRAALGDTH